MYKIIGYDDKNIILSSLITANTTCLSHKFRLKCTGFRWARQIKIAEVFEVFFWVYEGINTFNMAENLAHQTKWRKIEREGGGGGG